MKILAIDPGSKRIGLAASDELHLTIRLLPVLEMQGLSQSTEKLAGLIQEEGFHKVLVGHPLNMDGTVGPAAQESEKIAERLRGELKKRGHDCEVVLWDERLTSFAAEERIKQRGLAKAKAKAFLDSIAAEILLEDYLHTTEPPSSPEPPSPSEDT